MTFLRLKTSVSFFCAVQKKKISATVGTNKNVMYLKVNKSQIRL